MSMQVLVEPLPNGAGYRASTGAPLNFTATGATAEDALEDIGRRVAELVATGARIYRLPSIVIPTPRFLTPDEEEVERLYREAVEEYRDQCDREAELKYGVKIERSLT